MNTKKTLALLAVPTVILSALFMMGLGGQQYEGYVVVDAQRILQDSEMGREVQAEMENKQKQEQAVLQQMQEELQRLQKDSQNPSLSEADRQNLARIIQDKQTGLKRRYDDAQREFQKLSQQRLMELEKRIIPVLETVARENGFKMVFDKSRSGLAYSDPQLDITDMVVARLNSMR